MKRKLIKISAIGTALFGFAFVASAATWTPPTATPPANNVSAPINISTSTQTKEGGLVVGNTSGGFVNFGTSALRGHVDVGPYHYCYYYPTASACLSSTVAAPEYIALAKPMSLVAGIMGALSPEKAFATGTPTTDALHVYGNTSITGALHASTEIKIGAQNVCQQNGTNCPSLTSSFGPYPKIYSDMTNEYAVYGANAASGGGERVHVKGTSINIGTSVTSPTMSVGGDAVSIAGASNRNSPILTISSSGTANGDNAAGTERGLTIAASSAAGQGQLLNVKRGTTSLFSVGGNGNVGVGTSGPSTKLDVNGQIRIQGGSPGVGRVLTSDATGLATWGASTIAVYAMNPHCISDASSRQNGVLTFLPWCNEPGGGGRTWWNVKNAPYSTSGPGPYSYTLGTDGSNSGTAPPIGYGDVFFRGYQGAGSGRTLISGNCYGVTSSQWYQHCNAYFPPMGVIMPAEPVSSWPTSMTAPFTTGVGGGSGPYYVLP
jgi:hypothetical protein